ncbi:MAG: hypothetical protein KF799_01000 [Bdellovibrionales bacterium]|nr:hypothetical protein [Bdellovibrionales bacterium]
MGRLLCMFAWVMFTMLLVACGRSFHSEQKTLASSVDPGSGSLIGSNSRLAIDEPADRLPTQGSLQLVGACAAGLSVSVSGDIEQSQDVGCADGKFSVAVSLTAPDGMKTVQVYQRDRLNRSLASGRTFVRDTVGPAVSVVTPAEGTAAGASVIIQGLCENELPVQVTEGQKTYSLICTAGAFATTLPLTSADGSIQITFAQTDIAGNKSSRALNVVKDTGAPLLTLSQPAAGTSVQSVVNLQGTCENGLNVDISGNGAAAMSSVVCVNKAFSTSVALSAGDGAKALTVSQTDAAGNTASVQRSFVRDTTAPAVTISAPAAGTIGGTGLSLSGTCENGLTVAISGAGLQAPMNVTCANSAFNANIVFSAGDGAKNVTVAQTDAAGNVGTGTRSFVRDSSGPQPTIDAPIAGTAGKDGVTLQGACETGLSVVISGDVNAGSSVNCTSARYSAAIVFSAAEGGKNITITQTDAAGNRGTASRSFIKDSKPPVVTVAQPAEGASVPGTVTVSGACETGLPVNITGSGVSAVSANCANSAYSTTVVFMGGNGAKSITATQTDAAGNSGSVSRNVNAELSGPAVAITAPAADSLFVNTLTVSGTCQNGLAVNFSGSGWQSPANTTCSNGAFSAAITFTSGDGSKNLIASQTNASGQTGSASRSFNRDTTAPAVTINSPAAGTQAQASIRLQGGCENGLSVAIAGTGATATSATCSNGLYDVQVSLSAGDGTKNIRVSQTDLAGNVGSVARDFVRSNTVPVILITSPAAGSAYKTSLQLAGSCISGLTVNIAGAGAAAAASTACSNGMFSVSVNLSSGDGSKALQVSQTDAAGNTGSDTRSFVRDNVAPAPKITAPAANSAVGASLMLSGTCETGLTVTVSGSGITTPGGVTCNNATFATTLTVSAGDGVKSVSVAQTDAAGNSGSDSRSFNRDSTGPALTIASPAADTAAKTGVTITGACENGLAVSFSGTGLKTAGSVTCANGAYSFALVFSDNDGSKAVVVAQTDAAGNSTTLNRSFVRDNVAPMLTINSPAAGTSATTGLTISGGCEGSFNVTASGSGLTSPVTKACAAGAYSVDVAFSNGDGTKTIVLSQTDAAGNTANVSRDFTRTTPAADGSMLYASNCAICHGALATSTKKNRTAVQITAAIGGVSSMSSLSFLSANEITAIATALMGGSQPPPPPPVGAAASQYELALGTRTYMESTMNELFVSGSTADDTKIQGISNSMMFNKVVANGGPCLGYDSSCNSAERDTAPLALASPTGNTMRKGYGTRTCEQILEIDKAVSNVLGKAGLTSASALNTTNLQTLFQTFHPGRSAPDTVLSSLVTVASQAASKGYTALDQWRFVALPLCISSTLDIL